MPTIHIQVDAEQLIAIERRAKALGLSVEELASGALVAALSHGCDGAWNTEIRRVVKERSSALAPGSRAAAPGSGGYSEAA